MTELFREDSYLQQADTHVTAVDERGVRTVETVFFATGGGQPGDTGTLSAGGTVYSVTGTVRDADGIWHQLDGDTAPAVGDAAALQIDWARRHRIMRLHSALHMLCAIVPAPVTGGSIQTDRARLDFDLPDPIDKAEVNEKLQAVIGQDAGMSTRWITDAELDAQPELVRTLSVKPPRGSGRIRLVEFAGIDLQPCGGTHVARTGEIGPIRVQKIEKKGRQNRRIILALED
ncbi:MAG: alanyl-tRNA editing protein [Pseudomonadota bacterium]